MEKNQVSSESASPVKQKERRIVTWTPEEDDILREQIRTHGTGNWTIIASKFKDKTTRQCRRRWYTYLNSDYKKGGWSPEEDLLLCEAQKMYGNRWTEIAKVVSGRTDNAVKNRFTTLCKKKAKNQAMAKENYTSYINGNNKRAVSSSGGFQLKDSSDVSSPLKKLRAFHFPTFPEGCNIVGKGCTPRKHHLRPPFAVLAENIRKLNILLPQNQINPLNMLDKGNEKIGTFLKKDDPKMLALMQQADLLSSLANKVNTENTVQSLDNAWKVLENFLNKNEDSEVINDPIFEEDWQLDYFKDLVEELNSGNVDIQSSQRQPDMYDSPSSSEYSNGSMTSTNASEQMEQTQSEMCTLNDNARSGLRKIEANDENIQSTSDNKILARENSKQEEISVPCIGEEIDEDVSALLLSSPLQITPQFRSFAATVPSPQFSESKAVLWGRRIVEDLEFELRRKKRSFQVEDRAWNDS
ncbi:hypothetical protein V2J09_019985 [Rumex salicifolius]